MKREKIEKDASNDNKEKYKDNDDKQCGS